MNFNNLKEIIDFAIEKEREAADFYEKVSDEQTMSGAREMLKEFAAQERKHEQMLQGFLDKGVVAGIEDYKFKWITDIKRSDYVAEMTYKPGMVYHELLMLAMKREEKALALYNELLTQTDSAEAKNIFKMLCQEEAKHKLALETKYDDYMAEMGD